MTRARTPADLDPRDVEIAELRAVIQRALQVATEAFRKAGSNTGVVDVCCDIRNTLAPAVNKR